MRILWINHRDLKHPEAGGAEVHLAEVGKRLVERGHEVTLLAERFKGSNFREEVGGVKIIRFGGKFSLHLYAPYFVTRRSKDFDVIIDDVAHAVPFGSPMFTKKPVVAIVHHVHQKVLDRELPPPLRGFVKKAERSVGLYESIITVSQTTKRDLVEQLGVEGSKIRVIYYGVDHERYKVGLKFHEPTLLWIGRMKRYKNLNHLLKAFKSVKRHVENAKLILAGRGEEEHRIKRFVRENYIQDVIFAGWVSKGKKMRLLQGAWCVTYTSEVEGWGMGILEAAACGTPAVAYNSGALAEAIINGKTGLLVKYGDINELADKLIEMLRNDDLRATLSENALRHSFNFDWDKTAVETERYLENLV